MKGREIHWSDTGLNQVVWVRKIESLPFKIDETFDKFYEVVTISEKPMMYLAKGSEEAPREVCVYYKSGKFYSGFGFSFKEAIKEAVRDAIWYT